MSRITSSTATRYFPVKGGSGPVYFFILISHIGLSIVALPFILATLWYALRNQFQVHRRVARWTFPIWLYVSVTGVIVHVLLRPIRPNREKTGRIDRR